jgi:hypothetical protein
MKPLITIALMCIIGCAAPERPHIEQRQSDLLTTEDSVRGVVCYSFRYNPSHTLSCVKVGQ